LSDCRNITDGGLVHLQQLPLQHLDLSYCQISRTVDWCIFNSCLFNTSICLECTNITHDGLVHLNRMATRVVQ
jgi:hypothetical protein